MDYTRKWGPFIVGIMLSLLLLGFWFSSWLKVLDTDYMVIRQFGEVVRIVDEPGSTWKIPFIQSADRISKAQMIYDVQTAEINTKDKKRMLINNYAIWKIDDPKSMIRTMKNVENAEAKMGELIYSVVRAEFGQLNYDQIISDEKTGRGDLNVIITKKVNELLGQEKYGIHVLDIQMKRTDLPEANEQSVYTRMVSERESKAQEYLSIGDAEKNRTMAETDREVIEMIAKANAEAEIIRAKGEGEAAKIYNNSYSQDPEFYTLYRTLDSYKKTINNETVIIIPANSPYAKTLTGF